MNCQKVVRESVSPRSEGSVHACVYLTRLLNIQNHGQGHMVVNEVLCYISSGKNTSTIRQIKEAVINLFNQQAVDEAFHLYYDLRGKGLTSSAKASDKIIKCIMEWMTVDEGDMGIPHFVADDISW